MTKFLDELSDIRVNIEKAMAYEGDDEDEEYRINKDSKNEILTLILYYDEAHKKDQIDHPQFEDILAQSFKILSDNTGCAEDLEIMESILDALLQKKIISKQEYHDVVSNTSSNRWL